MPTELKIVIVGPKATGKSLISNYLAGSTQSLIQDKTKYDPTYGVRILEINDITLWDCSGDSTFENCLKAIMSNADGVILVYNPDIPGQDQQINDWYDLFVRKNGLKDEQCMIFAHREKENTNRFKPPPLFSRVTASVTTENSGADLRSMFDNFVKDVQGLRQRK